MMTPKNLRFSIKVLDKHLAMQRRMLGILSAANSRRFFRM